MKEYEKPFFSSFLFENGTIFLAASKDVENDNDFSDQENWFD